jgi:predicted transglutaminase-like cysteine proteinase
MLAFHSVLILIISFIGLAHAADDTGWASVGEPTQAPPGWIEFCKANPAECQAGATTPRDIVLSDKAIEDLKKVNSWVNGTVKVKEDIDHWGVIEKWSLPTDGFGDSEDFVLLKRKTLLNAGWPPRSSAYYRCPAR